MAFIKRGLDSQAKIVIQAGYKTKSIVVDSLEDLRKLRSQIKSREHISSECEFFTSVDGILVQLTNKKYPIKKQKSSHYDLRGKTLELRDGGYGDVDHFTEIEAKRKDSFFMPDYKVLNDYLCKFIKAKDVYKKRNLFYRAGILIYGTPGNGKTSWVRYLINNKVLPEDTIFIWSRIIPPPSFREELSKIPALKVFIFEEIVTSLQTGIFEVQQFLDFMDGEQSLDNSVYIATTNSPELLPQNIIQRPGRFDQIVEVKNPEAEGRRIVLNEYFKEEFKEEFIALTNGLSIAEIKEAYLLTQIHDYKLTDAVKKIKKHQEFVKNSFEEYKKVGFGFSED